MEHTVNADILACRKFGDSVQNRVGSTIGEFFILAFVAWLVIMFVCTALILAGFYLVNLCSIAKSPNLMHRQFSAFTALHGNADALSRCPCFPHGCRHCDCAEGCPNSEAAQAQVLRVITLTVSFPEWNKSELQDAQCQDEVPLPDGSRIKYGPDRQCASPYSPVTKSYWAQWDSWANTSLIGVGSRSQAPC